MKKNKKYYNEYEKQLNKYRSEEELIMEQIRQEEEMHTLQMINDKLYSIRCWEDNYDDDYYR